ncbi:MAG: hypothetical protein P8L44_19895 [Opitutales bacterium]|jgi:small neutral amino acid transporter SnatA (MarC family)|nr:hypothetical protein [Opitutales bacterium]
MNSTYLISLVCLLASKTIGKREDDILRRLTGVILVALSIWFVYDGIT